MSRRLLNLLTALSLVLCVAAVVLWVRSESVMDSFEWQVSDRRWVGVGSIRGGIDVFYSRTEPGWTATFLRPGYRKWPVGPGAGNTIPANWSFAGFEARGSTMSHVSGGTLRVPYWAVVACTAVVAALACRSAMIRRRPLPANQICSACGYDLRATPGRCPECGAVPPEGRKG